MHHTYEPIGVIETCFQEKFGAPRQSLMLQNAIGVIRLFDQFQHPSLIQGLENFSHLILFFIFDRNTGVKWRPLTTPPRAGLQGRTGTLACRSPYRPNPIGLSIVKLEKILKRRKIPALTEIHVSGVDLLNHTPLLDIKPYLPESDCIQHASANWATEETPQYRFEYTAQSNAALNLLSKKRAQNFRLLLEETLQWDPRPLSQRQTFSLLDEKTEAQIFVFQLGPFDVLWKIKKDTILILELKTGSREQKNKSIQLP